MRLLLDEMHSPAVARRLRERSHDVVAVKERPELSGLSDRDLLMASTADRRVLVTENVKDFAALDKELAARNKPHTGIVFTHPRRFPGSARNHVAVLADALELFLTEQAPELRRVESFVWWLDGPTAR